MANKSKRMRMIAEKLDHMKQYGPEEAFNLLKEVSTVKFKENVEVALNMGVDPRKHSIRGACSLPHGSGKQVRIAVFAQGPNADAAKAAGADIVGFEDLAESIKAGNLDFDVVIASPDAMRLVGQLGQVLGPRGLMPNPKVGTVTPNVADAVRKSKAGQVQFKLDKGGNIHCIIGNVEFTPEQLKDNLNALVADVVKARPAAAKGAKYIKKIAVSTTMGPGLILDPAAVTM